MGERLNAPGRAVADSVQELASAVVLALDAEASLDVQAGADDPVVLAAARVLGADVLAPSTLTSRSATEAEVALLDGALRRFPPNPGSPVSRWSHWGALVALGRARPGVGEPETGWLADQSWPGLTHQLAGVAMLAALAPSSLTALAERRVEDLARGFVRAVRRSDWPQAAGAGRWLAAVNGAPESLGLDAGLDFVELMGAGDARVALHIRVARILRRSPVA
ncbi:hypothetical protein [Actinokineospora sp. UTMC 2448]|uniref:hypothetical protein n=1 Tax=Actinokineospora sp. UTMC 2448 TaxID=2268449 RepID=UPI0021645911|nr:hypothetical protein [Actinokineospora sp. UTMC 2448]UVS78492.1 hypothetical protein Actkin_02225 [Actinokineospora sp. UTMC 2448]